MRASASSVPNVAWLYRVLTCAPNHLGARGQGDADRLVGGVGDLAVPAGWIWPCRIGGYTEIESYALLYCSSE